jgi:hypothetical protein
MAQKDLDKLADILMKKLYANSNKFREMVTARQVHEFSINEAEIRKKVRAELRDVLGYSGNKSLPKEFENVIRRETPKVTAEFHRLFTRAMANSKTYNIKIIGTSTKNFSVIIESKTGRAKVYNYFRRIKQVAQKPMILAIDDAIKNRGQGERRIATDEYIKNGKKRRDITASFLDIGHDDQTTNASLRSKMAEDILLDFAGNAQSPLLNKYVSEIFEDIFVRVTKGPTTKNGRTVFRASLDSSKGNKSKALQDAENAGNLQKALNKLMEAQAAGFPNQPGSDSPVEVLEKTVLNELAGIGKKTKLKSTKNLKVRKKSTLKKQRINTKGGTAQSKPVKKKATKAPPIKERKSKLAASAGTRAKRSPTSIVRMIAIFNQQLPERVMSNMGAPRLTNRTGTFANSVRVTDITKTTQGFPSIGYTYQKFPYQTFEAGGRQGSPDYDPRNLINQSIREIAVQFAMGRFYTRRM